MAEGVALEPLGAQAELPAPATGLIGREADVARVVAAVTELRRWLVTLTGPGGVGKTRLAVAAALDLAPVFPAGARFVPLDGLATADLILPTIADRLGAPEGGGSARERLRRHLAGRRLLLVLDTLEHLLPGARAEVEALHRACPDLVVLATSRAPLGARGEHVLAVEPLGLPPDDRAATVAELSEWPATRLFLARARFQPAERPLDERDAAAIAAVCRRLDGIPLAIELAAARTPLFRPAQLDEHLSLALLNRPAGGGPARQRTLRETIAWSEALLPAPVRALLHRLAVCAGGFGLDLVAALARGRAAGAPLTFAEGYDLPGPWDPTWGPFPEWPPLDPAVAPALAPLLTEDGRPLDAGAALQTLGDHHLLRPVAGMGTLPRWALYDAVRESGLAELRAVGEEPAARAAHAGAVLAWGEFAGLQLWGARAPTWAPNVDDELPNIRLVLTWGLTHGPTTLDLALRLAEGLWIFWQTRGHVTEGRDWLERALAHPGGSAWARANALSLAGFLAWVQQDFARCERLINESVAIWDALGDPVPVFRARCLLFRGLNAWSQGRPAEMVAIIAEARDIFLRYPVTANGVGICTIVLAIVARAQRAWQAALDLLDEAFRHCEIGGLIWGMATARYYAGEIARDLAEEAIAQAAAAATAGAAETAAECHQEAERQGAKAVRLLIEAIDRYGGDPWGTAACCAGLAALATQHGRYATAARLFGAAVRLSELNGAFLPTANPAALEAGLAAAQAADPAGFPAAFAAGRALTLAEAVAEARAFAAELAPPAKAPGLPIVVPHGRIGTSVEGSAPPPAGAARPADGGRRGRKPANPVAVSPAVEAWLAERGVEPRARRALFCLTQGLNHRQIAAALGVKQASVTKYLREGLEQLGLTESGAVAVLREVMERGDGGRS